MIKAIAAVSENWGIGYEGKLLFYIKPDLARFKELTMGKTVIMGRKTLATLPGGAPLKGRENLILSSTLSNVPGAQVFKDIDTLLASVKDKAEVMVIGGAGVYGELLPFCDECYITKVEASPKADAFFPDLDTFPEWALTERGQPQTFEGLVFRFDTYRKIK